jgi:hypothetical protein
LLLIHVPLCLDTLAHKPITTRSLARAVAYAVDAVSPSRGTLISGLPPLSCLAGGYTDARRELEEAILWPVFRRAAMRRLGVGEPGGVLGKKRQGAEEKKRNIYIYIYIY